MKIKHISNHHQVGIISLTTYNWFFWGGKILLKAEGFWFWCMGEISIMWVPLEDYPKGLFPNDFSILPYMKHSWYMLGGSSHLVSS